MKYKEFGGSDSGLIIVLFQLSFKSTEENHEEHKPE
jgi:hypothetical protein